MTTKFSFIYNIREAAKKYLPLPTTSARWQSLGTAFEPFCFRVPLADEKNPERLAILVERISFSVALVLGMRQVLVKDALFEVLPLPDDDEDFVFIVRPRAKARRTTWLMF